MAGRLLLYPGMGATAAMYARLCARLPWLTACDWPKPPGLGSFADLARACIARHGIGPDDIVAGASMGGMVACEIHRLVSCRALVLIGSCSDPRAVPLHRVAGLGARLLPDRLVAFSAASVPGGMRLKSSLLSDPAFVRWSLRAFAAWPGVDFAGDPRVHRIHGLLDPVIPAACVRADRLVPTGGHLIAITHAGAVAGFLRAVLAGCAQPPSSTMRLR